MPLARVLTSAIAGIDAISVDVEVQVRARGQPKFTIIGLADNAVRESRDRILSALRYCGFQTPEVVLVNLAPAEIKKEGSAFDLPIAVGVLAAMQQIDGSRLTRVKFHGELSLDARVKPVRGVVALAVEAARSGAEEIVVPASNGSEASLIHGLRVAGIKDLPELVGYLRDELELPPASAEAEGPDKGYDEPVRTLTEVWGQETAKRAMLIAAAGGHNLLMIGPPGCGKSMLAERFPGILPPLSPAEQLESVKIHSIAGEPLGRVLNRERPFRSPHHIISEAGLIGGGPNSRPGEISLAHNGVLFLDEFPEYRRCAVESLRGPLESGKVRITRARVSNSYPARFQLLAAMNPCPCGRLCGADNKCSCSQIAIRKYLQTLSQPILDRIDLHVELEAVPFKVIAGSIDKDSEHCRRWQETVLVARERQQRRAGRTNALLRSAELRRDVRLDSRSLTLLERSSERLRLSARGLVRVLRVARTIADLEGEEHVSSDHVSEAVGYRCLERIEKYCGLNETG